MVRPKLVTAAALLFSAPLLSGCGVVSLGGDGGCVDTELEAQSVVVGDKTEPLTLVGTLTADDGQPVEGAELFFFMHLQDEEGEVSATTVGSAVTDAEGVAERPYPGGSQDISAFRSEEAVGYSVEFRQIGLIDDVRYCDARSGMVELDVPCAGFACRF